MSRKNSHNVAARASVSRFRSSWKLVIKLSTKSRAVGSAGSANFRSAKLCFSGKWIRRAHRSELQLGGAEEKKKKEDRGFWTGKARMSAHDRWLVYPENVLHLVSYFGFFHTVAVQPRAKPRRIGGPWSRDFNGGLLASCGYRNAVTIIRSRRDPLAPHPPRRRRHSEIGNISRWSKRSTRYTWRGEILPGSCLRPFRLIYLGYTLCHVPLSRIKYPAITYCDHI